MLIVQIELLLIIVLLVLMLRRYSTKTVRLMGTANKLSPVDVVEDSVQLLRKTGKSWNSFGIRPEGHPDILEALNTPGLAIQRGNSIEEGTQ